MVLSSFRVFFQVNDVSVTQRSHKELVDMIKNSPNPMSMILLASVSKPWWPLVLLLSDHTVCMLTCVHRRPFCTHVPTH